MTQQDYTQHWITPPPELVSKWTRNRGYSCSSELWDYLATQAAQWGADQELEACCEWLDPYVAICLRSDRRPMTNLSPAAQLVLDAANNVSSYGPDDCLNDARPIAIAALHAIAEVNAGTDYQNGKRVATIIRSAILAVATELEALDA